MAKQIESVFRGLKQAGVIGLVAATPFVASAAETVHLYLKADGQDIQGESTQTSLGRENSIECVSLHTSAQRTGESVSGGRFLIHKRIDKSSPLLLKALVQGQNVDAVFKFFRPNPTGDGTTEQFYTISTKLGRVVSVEQVVPDVIVPESSNFPPVEAVTIQARDVVFTYTDGGVTFGTVLPEPR